MGKYEDTESRKDRLLLAATQLFEQVQCLGVVADQDDLVVRLRVYAVEEPMKPFQHLYASR